jgi:DNA modification methylase
MNIEKIQINKLKAATYNPRQISTKQYKDLKESISKFGLVDPIIINKCYTIIGGHQRYKICKDLDYKDIGCIILDLNKEQERELNIRLNKNTGEFDMDILANEFDIDQLVDWGFKHIDLDINIDKITEGNTEDDHIPEVKESRVKLGDVWQLGKHRIMCGDSTKESDVEKLMNGQKADMVFTDPPYGMDLDTNYKDIYKNAKSKTENQKKVIGDNKQFDPTFLLSFSKEVFIWGADYFCQMLTTNGSWFVWNKKIGKGKIGNEFELCWSKQKHKKEILEIEWAGFRGMEKDDGKRIHPTQKPITLCSHFVNKFSQKENIILDLFLGSGSTLIACEKTNRICYGMELDTKYCDVIIERWEQFTGQKATKL